MDRALWSDRSIVGYIPSEAFDRAHDLLAIEVNVELKNGRRISIPTPTRCTELRMRLRCPNSGGVPAIRCWILDRARTRFELSYPELAGDIARIEVIHWICGNGRRREPFLR